MCSSHLQAYSSSYTAQRAVVHGQHSSAIHPFHPMSLAYLLAAYKKLLATSPTESANQSLLTFVRKGQVQTVTVTMLARALRLMLQDLELDTGLNSLHSLHRGGATAVYMAGANHHDINRHGIWSNDAFWAYIMAPCVSTSLVTRAVAAFTSVCLTCEDTCQYHLHLLSKCIFASLTLYLLHLKFYFTIFTIFVHVGLRRGWVSNHA